MMDGVTSEIEISAPIDRVFKALTDPKQLFDWWGREPSVELTKFEMEAKKGARWRFECQPVPGMPQGPVVETLQRQGVNASRTLVSSRWLERITKVDGSACCGCCSNSWRSNRPPKPEGRAGFHRSSPCRGCARLSGTLHYSQAQLP